MSVEANIVYKVCNNKTQVATIFPSYDFHQQLSSADSAEADGVSVEAPSGWYSRKWYNSHIISRIILAEMPRHRHLRC